MGAALPDGQLGCSAPAGRDDAEKGPPVPVGAASGRLVVAATPAASLWFEALRYNALVLARGDPTRLAGEKKPAAEIQGELILRKGCGRIPIMRAWNSGPETVTKTVQFLLLISGTDINATD